MKPNNFFPDELRVVKIAAMNEEGVTQAVDMQMTGRILDDAGVGGPIKLDVTIPVAAIPGLIAALEDHAPVDASQ